MRFPANQVSMRPRLIALTLLTIHWCAVSTMAICSSCWTQAELTSANQNIQANMAWCDEQSENGTGGISNSQEWISLNSEYCENITELQNLPECTCGGPDPTIPYGPEPEIPPYPYEPPNDDPYAIVPREIAD